ncbi:hypothetical protein [Arenimonas sp.]|nr:hypothetical protein [Arenimonas sp.]
MSVMFGFFGVLGFIFGVTSFVYIDQLKKRVDALEAERASRLP